MPRWQVSRKPAVYWPHARPVTRPRTTSAPPRPQHLGRLVADVRGLRADRPRGTGRSRNRSRPYGQVGEANYKPAGESAGNLMLGSALPAPGNPDTLRRYGTQRVVAIFGCMILAGCASWFPSNTAPPIASWSGKRPIDDAVDCVKRALDYNFRSARSPIPDITHHVDTVEQGRVYDVSPPVGPYHVRVKSNGSETTIELFMPGTMYSVPLRDSLAKCP
jgi:hypothetical protein